MVRRAGEDRTFTGCDLGDSMNAIRHTDMLAGGPLAELLATAESEFQEVAELAPDSSLFFERARMVRLIRGKLEEARNAAPKCGTEEAAGIMGVSTRQATKLAKAGKIVAWQKDDRFPWTFDVRSCHAYAARKGEKAA